MNRNIETLPAKYESMLPVFLQEVSRPDRFSYLLRIYRERVGLSCADMSRCCGLDANTWAALENCELLNPSCTVLMHLSLALNIQFELLLLVSIISAYARESELH